jgi:hypothetical protein
MAIIGLIPGEGGTTVQSLDVGGIEAAVSFRDDFVQGVFQALQ